MTKRSRLDWQSSQRLINGSSDSEKGGDGAVYITGKHRRIEEFADKLGRTEKQLAVLLIISLVVIICLITYVLLMNVKVYYHQNDIPVVKDCVTPKCILSSAELIRNMNISVDPCEDYYEYACGNWIEHTIVPADKPKWTSFAQVYKKNQAIVKQLLEQPGMLYKGANSTSVDKVKTLYASCMNRSEVDDNGKKHMLTLIKYLGGWTIVAGNTWDAKSWNIIDNLMKIHRINLHPFFDMDVSADEKDSKKNIIHFSQSGLTLGSRSEYLNDKDEKYYKAYTEFFARYAILLGAKSGAEQKMKINNVYDFEKKLAKVYIAKENLTDPTKRYNRITVGDLMDTFKPIQIKSYIDGMFQTDIPKEEDVIVHNVGYFEDLAKLISETKNETLANYMMWYTVQNLVSYMPNSFREAALILDKAEKGVTALASSYDLCVSKADDILGFASGALYVEKKFTEHDKEQVKMILKYINDAFIMDLPKITWMTQETKLKAMEKAKAVIDQIGFPGWIQDPKKLDEHYENLTIVKNNLFANGIAARIWSVKRILNRRGKAPDRLEWHMTPDTVNAYYNGDFNYIAFPAGILQSPFYEPSMPMVVNFGSVGMVMGHELTHGFDNTGRHFDQFGNMADWWDKKSVDAFEEKAQCIVDQYSSYTIQGHHVNGKTTLGENIADNGGLKTALNAYNLWHTANFRINPKMVGLDLNEQQLFFLGFSRVWCSYYQPAFAVSALTTDVHGPAKYRVNGVLSNMEQFANAYKCPSGTTMNPGKKCVVW